MEIAEKISAGLANTIVVAKVNNEVKKFFILIGL